MKSFEILFLLVVLYGIVMILSFFLVLSLRNIFVQRIRYMNKVIGDSKDIKTFRPDKSLTFSIAPEGDDDRSLIVEEFLVNPDYTATIATFESRKRTIRRFRIIFTISFLILFLLLLKYFSLTIGEFIEYWDR